MDSASLSWMMVIMVMMKMMIAAMGASPDACNSPLNLPQLKFPSSSLSCQQVWPQFHYILRYMFNRSSNVLSILLSANQMNNWISIGFSPNGAMIGSSAIVGYLQINGTGGMKQYHLKGKTSNLVIPDKGDLNLVPGTELLVVHNQTTYLAFQLHMNQTTISSSKLILAFGYPRQLPDPNTNQLSMHLQSHKSTFDFVTGTALNIDRLRRNHGIVNIIGWSLLAPTGAIFARYSKKSSSSWFYLHIGFQTSSFLFAIIGLGMGVQLINELPGVSTCNHVVLGVFVLVLGFLQVLALCFRPPKGTEIRKYWNWYHHSIGQFVLLLAAINIVMGINLAGSGYPWKISYAFILVITIFLIITLETIYWYKQNSGNIYPMIAFTKLDNV